MRVDVFSGDRHAGALTAHRAPGSGREVVEFVYTEDWLADGFPLSPELPLDRIPRRPTLGREMFGAFEDAGPDSWGQRLLQERARRDGIPVCDLTPTMMLLLVPDAARQGALRFRIDGAFHSPTGGAAPWVTLAELHAAAATLADTGDPRTATELLLAAGAAPGGAQPKASVRDEHGTLWLAKFPSQHAAGDQGRWEQAAALASRDAGITVADSRAIPVDDWTAVFATRRFDRDPDGGRIPYVSFRTMLQRTGAGHEPAISYVNLARELRRWSADPAADTRQLFLRAAFNAAICNNDDHLRNFGLLRHGGGWRLSPAFDVNPAPGVPASTPLTPTGSLTDRDPHDLLDHAPAFGLTPTAARDLLDQALDGAARLTHHAEQAGVHQDELDSAWTRNLDDRIRGFARDTQPANGSPRTGPSASSGEPRCRVCGRPLQSAESIAAGVGPTCARREQTQPRGDGESRL